MTFASDIIIDPIIDGANQGLTKREHFASMAMQGIITSLSEIGVRKLITEQSEATETPYEEIISTMAVNYADKLIAALNQ